MLCLRQYLNTTTLAFQLSATLPSFDSGEAIADLAKMLLDLECAEGLRELQKVSEFTSDRLNRATQLLPKQWQQQLRQWAILNRTSAA